MVYASQSRTPSGGREDGGRSTTRRHRGHARPASIEPGAFRGPHVRRRTDGPDLRQYELITVKSRVDDVEQLLAVDEDHSRVRAEGQRVRGRGIRAERHEHRVIRVHRALHAVELTHEPPTPPVLRESRGHGVRLVTPWLGTRRTIPRVQVGQAWPDVARISP